MKLEYQLAHYTKSLKDETRVGYIHLVYGNHTLCGKEINNPRWLIIYDGKPTCPKCCRLQQLEDV